MNKIFCFVVAAEIIFPGIAPAQPVPSTISHQGYLADSSGHPVNGTVNMTFRFYADSAAAIPVFTNVFSTVPVTNGVYNVELGGVGGDLLKARYLSIEVNGQVQSPPLRLTGVPYSLVSQ